MIYLRIVMCQKTEYLFPKYIFMCGLCVCIGKYSILVNLLNYYHLVAALLMNKGP